MDVGLAPHLIPLAVAALCDSQGDAFIRGQGHLKYIREFVGEFALALIWGQGKVAILTKIALWILLILGGSFVPTDEVSFTIGKAESPAFSMLIGHLISASIGLVLFASCLVLAWEQFRRFLLRFADEIETTDEG